MSCNKVYYGEYTLKHWIELMLHRNIVLPEYQRTFVWDKSKVINFFNSLYNDYFIPPITIGYLHRNNQSTNLIIDGQQRLTSLLLGCLSLYPRIEKFKNTETVDLADENDDENDNTRPILGWTIRDLLKNRNDCTISSIINENPIIKDGNYENLNISFEIDDSFLESHFLGFSYLVPSGTESQSYFCNAFKSINTAGVSLSPLEARKSLYFLKPNLETLFDPNCCSNIIVDNGSRPERIDFVKYLSFAFQYNNVNSFDMLAKNYGKKYEEYYSDFIMSVVNGKSTETFSLCQNANIKQISTLKNTIDKMGLTGKRFNSIIDADLYFFGLVYYVIVKKKQINIEKKDELIEKLEDNIASIKEVDRHKKSPAALKYLRLRIQKSHSVYKDYIL